MAVPLHDEQKLEREIRVHGIELPVIVTLTSTGLSFRVKGSPKTVYQGWVQVVQNTYTPGDIKSYLAGRPYEMLKTVAAEMAKNRKKKADKEESTA